MSRLVELTSPCRKLAVVHWGNIMKSGDWAATGPSPPVTIVSGDARTITNATKARELNWKVTKPNHNRVDLLTDPGYYLPLLVR